MSIDERIRELWDRFGFMYIYVREKRKTNLVCDFILLHI